MKKMHSDRPIFMRSDMAFPTGATASFGAKELGLIVICISSNRWSAYRFGRRHEGRRQAWRKMDGADGPNARTMAFTPFAGSRNAARSPGRRATADGNSRVFDEKAGRASGPAQKR